MRVPDKVPSTMPHMQFPMGDIDDAHLHKRAQEWFDEHDSEDYKQFFAHIASSYVSKPLDSLDDIQTHSAAMSLCFDWDKARGNERRFAITGYMLARAFQKDTHFLPKSDENLCEPLEQMRLPEHRNTALDFARAAWSGMEYGHPKVFAQHEKLHEIAKRLYDFEVEGDMEYFLAGLSLPYMLALTSRLAKYANTNGFTSMSGEKCDLQTSEFSLLFTKEKELAHENPKRRKI